MQENPYLYNTKVSEFLDSTTIKHYSKNIRRLTEKEKQERQFEKGNVLDSIYRGVEFEKQCQGGERSLENSLKRTKTKIYELAQANKWKWFVTLTFNPDLIDNSDYNLLASKLNDYFSNLKKRVCPNLKYLIVPELHKDGKKYHFHGLLADCGGLIFQDSGHYIDGIKQYNLFQWKYGFSWCSIVNCNKRVASYITKYITKDLLCTLSNKKRYWCSRNLDKPVEYFLSCSNKEKDILIDSIGELSHVSSFDCSATDNILNVYYVNK